MEEHKDGEHKIPFEIEYDEGLDWFDLTIDVELKSPASKEEKQQLEKTLANWADKGVDEGYGEGKMHDWNEEENEWDKKDERYRFWVDMGSSDETALDVLCGELSKLELVKKIRIGSRYYD